MSLNDSCKIKMFTRYLMVSEKDESILRYKHLLFWNISKSNAFGWLFFLQNEPYIAFVINIFISKIIFINLLFHFIFAYKNKIIINQR